MINFDKLNALYNQHPGEELELSGHPGAAPAPHQSPTCSHSGHPLTSDSREDFAAFSIYMCAFLVPCFFFFFHIAFVRFMHMTVCGILLKTNHPMSLPCPKPSDGFSVIFRISPYIGAQGPTWPAPHSTLVSCFSLYHLGNSPRLPSVRKLLSEAGIMRPS